MPIRDFSTDSHLVSVTAGAAKTTIVLRRKGDPQEPRQMTLLQQAVAIWQMDTTEAKALGQFLATLEAQP